MSDVTWWVLLSVAGAFSILGVLMNWLWALLASVSVLGVALLYGVYVALGWWGVSFVGVVTMLTGAAVLYREHRDSRSRKDFGRLTKD